MKNVTGTVNLAPFFVLAALCVAGATVSSIFWTVLIVYLLLVAVISAWESSSPR